MPLWWFSPPKPVGLTWKPIKDGLGLDLQTHRTIGYINDGNTCFANSVIQMLNYSPTLFSMAHNYEHSTNCARRKKLLYCGACDFELNLTKSWKNDDNHASLFSHMVSTDRVGKNCAVPWLLKSMRKSPELQACKMRIGAQHCAHEFYMALMRFVNRHEIPAELEGAFRRNAVGDFESATTRYGQALYHPRTTVKECQSCGHLTTATMWNYDITIMPNEFKSTLQESLSTHFRDSYVGDGAKCKCDNCKNVMVNKKQRVRISLNPAVLIICLQRTQLGTMRRLKKNDSPMDIPASLNIKPWSLSSPKHTSIDHQYELCSFVRHYGGASGGHYVAYGKTPEGRWVLCDDSTISDIDQASTMKAASKGAFLLCYSKVKRQLEVEDNELWQSTMNHSIEYAETVLKKASSKDILYGSSKERLGNERVDIGLINAMPPTSVLCYEDVQPFIMGKVSRIARSNEAGITENCFIPDDSVGITLMKTLMEEEDTNWVMDRVSAEHLRYITPDKSDMNDGDDITIGKLNDEDNSNCLLKPRFNNTLTKISKSKLKRLKKKQRMFY